MLFLGMTSQINAQAKRKVSPKQNASNKITLNGVKLNNFYKKNEGNYGEVINITKVGDSEVGGSNVAFEDYGKAFVIYITASDDREFKRNRALIESKFLKVLGITKSDACKLNVRENRSNGPSTWDGTWFGLSFCPKRNIVLD